MTAATLWVLLALLPADHDRQPAMVIERFRTQAECLDLLATFPPTARVTFECLPSLRIDARMLLEPSQ
ncbi:hypothetical protein [Achromobacter sp.]|uniref:hypothetical protein n=1 Tax=Achromobacter sp. TaxID=134375 RepID=UPI0028B203D0|nr:hypothetical protein [Achromobacter sp.]